MEKVLPNIYIVDSFKYIEDGVISSYIVNFEKTVIIDPGTAKGADIILNEINPEWNVEYICPTHIHIDHGGGAAKLAKTLNSKILVHPRGVRHVVDPSRLWEASKAVLGSVAELYGRPESIEEERIIAVQDGQEFDLGGDILQVFHAPGHAPHMLVYFLRNSKVLFPADAVGMFFNGAVFPLTPPPFEFKSALKTLERLQNLDVKYVAFTHYGIAEGKWPLRTAYDKMVDWMKIAKEVVKNEGGVDEYIDMLKEVDSDVKMVLESIKDKPVAVSFIHTSAKGMVDAAKKMEGL